MIVRAAAAVVFGLGLSIASAASAQQAADKAQAQKSDPARPRDSTANLPSDSGAQTTTPRGAVTGAGQPQGKGVQPDVGSTGGLEPRARAKERAKGASDPSAASGTAGGAQDTGARRTRAARDAKG
ncbi:MAG TPA: hypothetical protein VED01_13945 [Burkholderiales bacterium]|nr:hypothetical protein [Burkholderiales bacterium]